MEIAEIVKAGNKKTKVRFRGESCTRTLRNNTIREFLRKQGNYCDYYYSSELFDMIEREKPMNKATVVNTTITEIYW